MAAIRRSGTDGRLRQYSRSGVAVGPVARLGAAFVWLAFWQTGSNCHSRRVPGVSYHRVRAVRCLVLARLRQLQSDVAIVGSFDQN